MPNFEKYVARLGEFGVQAIIERIERNEGIRVTNYSTLEDRWNILMQVQSDQHQMVA